MGITRKLMSVSTLGVVKYRTNAEQQARVAKQTRNAARANVAQNQVLIDLQRQALEQERQAQAMRAAQVAATQMLAGPTAQQAVQPGWYPDPRGNGGKAWWDGAEWKLPQWDGEKWVMPL